MCDGPVPQEHDITTADLTTADLTITNIVRRGNTIFMPLPVELHQSSGECVCSWCEAHREKFPEQCSRWDTLAVSTKAPKKGCDHTWLVHYPQLAQPAR
jgi:hypothetical protein